MIDPVQSVKGKVVIDAFRMIPGIGMMMMPTPGSEPRQTTSHVGHLKKPTIQARIHGLDKYYHSIVIDWRKNDLEEQMLMNLHKKDWSNGLQVQEFDGFSNKSSLLLDQLTKNSKAYVERVKEEEGFTPEEMEVKNVGKTDPKKHLEADLHDLMSSCIVQSLSTMINTVIF